MCFSRNNIRISDNQQQSSKLAQVESKQGFSFDPNDDIPGPWWWLF